MTSGVVGCPSRTIWMDPITPDRKARSLCECPPTTLMPRQKLGSRPASRGSRAPWPATARATHAQIHRVQPRQPRGADRPALRRPRRLPAVRDRAAVKKDSFLRLRRRLARTSHRPRGSSDRTVDRRIHVVQPQLQHLAAGGQVRRTSPASVRVPVPPDRPARSSAARSNQRACFGSGSTSRTTRGSCWRTATARPTDCPPGTGCAGPGSRGVLHRQPPGLEPTPRRLLQFHRSDPLGNADIHLFHASSFRCLDRLRSFQQRHKTCFPEMSVLGERLRESKLRHHAEAETVGKRVLLVLVLHEEGSCGHKPLRIHPLHSTDP